MERNVLIVDDDQTLIHLINKKFQAYNDSFIVTTAEDGTKAVDILKEKYISLVVTDLKMPKMDGFALLAHLSENYPDIPVIITTAYGTPDSKKVAIEGGAAGFIEKPFELESLANKIKTILQKELEGGSLHNVSLETFIQLIEMEQKTCTIRVHNKATEQRGVLFFREGEILNARINNTQGNKAAYEIFSWEKITLSIENVCAQKKKAIEGDLQGVLLEAMRLKDEAEGGEDEFDEFDETEQMGGDPDAFEDLNDLDIQEVELEDDEPLDLPDAETAVESAAPDPIPEPVQLSALDALKQKIDTQIEGKAGIKDIIGDDSWQNILQHILTIGQTFGAGELKACFFNKEEANDFFVVPGSEVVSILVKPGCARDKIFQVLCK